MYSEEIKRPGIKNHFYTLNGQSVNRSKEFIQILELDKDIKKDSWEVDLSPITSSYNLKPIDDEKYEMSGSFKLYADLDANAYAAPIYVNGQDHLLIYISHKKPNLRNYEIIHELKNIGTSL